MASFSTTPNSVFSHWHHPVANFSTSTQDFYASVEQALAPHQVPGIETSRIEWKEGGALSANRQYLRIRREKLVFDICAAPFGADYFFSWWLAEIPPKHGLLRLAGMLCLTLLSFGIFMWIFEAIFGSSAGDFVAFLIALVAYPALAWLLGNALAKGTFGPGAEEAVIATPFFGWLYLKLFNPFTYYKTDTKLMFQATVSAAVNEAVDRLMEARGLRTMSDLERKPVMKAFAAGA
jgi:hypothetical protein